jgi:hypothetical protein
VQSFLLPDTQLSFSGACFGFIERRESAVAPVNRGMPASGHFEIDVLSPVENFSNLPAVTVDVVNNELNTLIAPEQLT